MKNASRNRLGVIESALDTALFGVDWDASVCEQRLERRRGCLAAGEHAAATHNLQQAIEALHGARASFAAAERFAAKLTKGGRR